MPWLEGYKPQGRDAQQLWHKQQKRAELPPGLTIAAPVISQALPAVTTTVSKCGFSGDVRPKRRAIVDVVKHKRLDVSIAPFP